MISLQENTITSTWMNDLPLVSICCITFNHSQYIADALDSFLIQKTTFPFEIIVRDDCSTDGTTEIIREYAENFPRLIKPIYESSNQYSQGVQPFPVVMSHAQGKYIAICEGDDYWTDPTKLQKQFDFLQTHPDFSMIFHNATIHDYSEYGDINVYPHNIALPSGEISIAQILITKIVPTASVVFRSSIDLSPYFAKRYPVGDTPLFMFLGKFGKIYYSDETTSVYRLLPTGMVKSALIKSESHIAFLTYYKDLMVFFHEFALNRTISVLLAQRYLKIIKSSWNEKKFWRFFNYNLLYFKSFPIQFLKDLLIEIKYKLFDAR